MLLYMAYHAAESNDRSSSEMYKSLRYRDRWLPCTREWLDVQAYTGFCLPASELRAASTVRDYARAGRPVPCQFLLSRMIRHVASYLAPTALPEGNPSSSRTLCRDAPMS